jgi:hypothetical protein
LRIAAAANRRTIARSSPKPAGPGCGQNAPARANAVVWSPGRDQHQVGIQGEQPSISCDGFPLQREMSAAIWFRQVACCRSQHLASLPQEAVLGHPHIELVLALLKAALLRIRAELPRRFGH